MNLESKTIGQRINELRKAKGLSQAQLAQEVSISPQAVGKWERGESMPDITTFARLADLFSVDLNYFTNTASLTQDSVTRAQEVQETKAPEHKTKQKHNWSWDMSRGNWTDSDFSGLSNLGDKFNESNVKNCSFKQADLSQLTLRKNNVDGCDFSEANMRESSIQSSNLCKNIFQICSLIDARFDRNNISGCDFTQSNLSGAEFSENYIEKCDFEGAQFAFTSFKNCAFSEIVFSGMIEDCHFENCGFHKVRFSNATIKNTFFKYNRKFGKVVFENCTVDHISYAFLKNNGAKLEGIEIVD